MTVLAGTTRRSAGYSFSGGYGNGCMELWDTWRLPLRRKKKQFDTLSRVGTTMLQQMLSNAMDPKLAAAVDWQAVIRVGFNLLQEILKEQKDWQAIIALVVELFRLFNAAQEATGLAINWEAILKLILTLLPIFFPPK